MQTRIFETTLLVKGNSVRQVRVSSDMKTKVNLQERLVMFNPSGIKCKYNYNLTKACLNRAVSQPLVLVLFQAYQELGDT